MKHLAVILFFCFTFSLSLTGCDNGIIEVENKSTNTSSNEFSTLEDKVAFLQRHFKLKRNYRKLDFSIVYHDNSTGGIPGPSDWDIVIVAIVLPSDLDQWVAGFKQFSHTPDTTWLSAVTTDIDYSSINEWYDIGFSSMVGINREKGLVAYRNVTN